LGRLFAPILNGRSGGRSNSGGTRDNSSRREGDVRVEFTKKQKSSKKDGDQDKGEYIDFEEID